MKHTLALFAILMLLAFNANSQKFAILSDIHVTPGNQCDSALRVAVEEINQVDYDMVIVDGDLTNEGSDEQLKT